ncbi:hypothetical protein [Streptomyces griseofuscus]|uniref:hypothetical protein n=1 Tax=Streptomyces griseofuscus TaxID=146922 RepID=UPI0034551376
MRAWGSAWEPIEHLACGPALIDLLPASPQAAVLPAGFPFPHLPLATALRRLGTGLGTPPPDLTPLLARATDAPAPAGTTPVLNPAALVAPEPADPTPAELAGLRTALDALIAEAEVR